MKWIVLASLLILASGCSMDASLEQISENSPIKFQDPAKTTGLVSGSTQTGTATGGGVTYHVQSTVGNYMSGIEQTTADKTYKVYSSVQGAIVSN
ncbi:hypothetical protein EZJ49_14995 [Bdellovibrio bacteriovorus]|uniref:hypothetical protein n=1 Tax=Bdellovibrio bacteriovorus TaxID=959 RepID=UPI0021CFAAB0|nr:hypothetical protein [Bdellovibrio bacteriovorus]UXR64374.1 hypothetical protein EZJ49_14995 [Bdellovibrio bacteriovorus]